MIYRMRDEDSEIILCLTSTAGYLKMIYWEI